MTRPLMWRVAAVVVLIVGFAVCGIVFGVPTESELRTQFSGTGAEGYVLFASVYLVIALLPVPKNVLSIAAGSVFGFAAGLAVVLVGATAGAAAAFAIGRVLGRDVVHQYLGKRAEQLNEAALRRGFVSILVLRLVPVVPFTPLNYMAGTVALRFGDYVLATAVGITPGTSAFVALGAFGNKPGSLPFVSAVLALVVLTGVGIAGVAQRRAGDRNKPANEPGRV